MSTQSIQTHEVCCLRNLRRVRVFLGRRAVTFVTYYRNTSHTEDAADFVGRVTIWSLWNFSRIRVEAAHTRLPPPFESSNEDEEPEEEIDPAITHGYSLLPA